MDFRILGSTEVLDGTRRVELPAGRGRALLALLILHAGEPVAAERIIDELWGEAMEDRFEAALALSRGGELVAELEGMIAVHPFRERLHGFLMLALYRAGRQAEALEVYRKAHSLLIEEIGLEPGPALREL